MLSEQTQTGRMTNLSRPSDKAEILGVRLDVKRPQTVSLPSKARGSESESDRSTMQLYCCCKRVHQKHKNAANSASKVVTFDRRKRGRMAAATRLSYNAPLKLGHEYGQVTPPKLRELLAKSAACHDAL